MTNKEAVIWLINLTADIGKAKHRDLWHYEQALSEIKEMLESGEPERKEKAIQYVEESLSNIYCSTCKNDENYEECDYCHRKSMMWQISHDAAEDIVYGIVKILEDGEQE